MTTPQEPELNARLTRRQRELLRDFDVSGKLKDIRDDENLRDNLAPKWWETVIGVLQFGAALGLLAAVVQYPALRTNRILQVMAFFFALMVISFVLGFEFLIFKLYHLRRAHSIAQRRIKQLEDRIDQVEKHGSSAQPAAEVSSEASSKI